MISRRAIAWCALALATAASTFVPGAFAQAQSYPTRPVRLVVALAAGGPTDIVMRIVAAKMSEQLGQQIVVDNRAAAGGSVAGEIVANAPADGYTLFAGANGTIAIAPSLFRKLPFSISRDFTPIALLGNSPFAVMVHPGVPAASVKELLALAKTKPGAINFGSSGQGGTGHLATELLILMTGVRMTHVPYKGAGPALIGLVSKEIELMISGLASGLPYIKQKQIRAIAVTSPKRVPQLPDVPPVADTVAGYEAGSWYAILARAGTPRPIVERLNREAATALNSPDVNAKLVSSGVDPDPLTPEQLGAKIRAETDRWAKVVKAAGLKTQ
ncbi:MAG TPA: tripartite tricarboxylate transporter substrate binding protein [Burkholderiales bacterium]|nr:tripartite tricarboxylate transporter substrate binding protein [Burkholderiales bacterium]